MDSAGATRRIQHKGGWVQLVELEAVELVVVNGPDAPRRAVFELPAVRIGSASDNDLVLTDTTVSRHHATIARTDHGWQLTDLKSSNGSFVRGVRVHEAILEPGLEFSLGATSLFLKTRTEEHYAIPSAENQLGQLVGSSSAMREVFALIRAVARTPATVLIEGESGTGKELTAKAIHELSERTGRLVAFDCGSASSDLIRSELFGHTAGSFTGANAPRDGAFRTAHRGTLFIDEVGDLPLGLQPTLLRVLETREVTPVGSDRPIAVDVRVVAATNLDLDRMVKEGRFRHELHHRLSVIRIRLPALRERLEDIPGLVTHFCTMLGVTSHFGQEALDLLAAQSWPGNVRSLRNAIERVGILCPGREVTARDLRFLGGEGTEVAEGSVNLEAVEKETILKAMQMSGGNQVRAAKLLGIALSTLKNKLKRYRGHDDDPAGHPPDDADEPDE